jgi:hypothetical protein
MRFVLALGLLAALCTAADAARVHHAYPRHVFGRPAQAAGPRLVRPRQSPNPNDPPVLEDQTPAYDDPSKFGSG